jgi:hypothetical protein
MTPTVTAPDPTAFPENVRHFAAERGVTEYLVPLYQLAQQCFGGAEVAVTFETDYEIPGLSWIVYAVAARHLAAEPRRAGRRRWTAEVVRALPPAAREPFALRVQ